MELAAAARCTHRPRPAPAQDGPGAAPCARRRRPQDCALRLGRRAAVAPPPRARRLPPAPSASVSLSCRPSPFALSSPSSRALLSGCRAQPRLPPSPQLESVSLAAAAGEAAAAARGPARLLLRLSSSAAPRPLPAAPRGAPLPHPCSLLSEAGGALCGFPQPPRRAPGLALPERGALGNSCPAGPDRQGVPQGRRSAERRQRGPCGACLAA